MIILSKFQKFCIAVLSLLVSLFIFFALPINSFNEKFVEDCIEDVYDDEDDALKSYNELRPNVYNLAFGGERDTKFKGYYSSYKVEVDYSEYPAHGMKLVFFLNIASIILTIVALAKSNRTLMKTVLALNIFTAASFVAILSGALSNCVLADSMHVTMGFGSVVSILVYLAAIVTSIHAIEAEAY